jgi:hypothetical protein
MRVYGRSLLLKGADPSILGVYPIYPKPFKLSSFILLFSLLHNSC